ncbi:hypothetical protein KIPB_009252 [Kipferlia bialata]|uniref:Uncharacterized protein n=1 Tax=Kipferlia bialata TaxID=797122 RepID=A0A391NNR4_9EUKA|nr:hypothetical protein KIPB_009252 [Kipferlia bialata]|eukprot:g9252.t1
MSIPEEYSCVEFTEEEATFDVGDGGVIDLTVPHPSYYGDVGDVVRVKTETESRGDVWVASQSPLLAAGNPSPSLPETIVDNPHPPPDTGGRRRGSPF